VFTNIGRLLGGSVPRVNYSRPEMVVYYESEHGRFRGILRRHIDRSELNRETYNAIFESECGMINLLPHVERRGFWAMTSEFNEYKFQESVYDPVAETIVSYGQYEDLRRQILVESKIVDYWQENSELNKTRTETLVKNGAVEYSRVLISGYLHNAFALMLCVSFVIGIRSRHVLLREQRRLAKFLCPSCKYDIRGLSSKVCPECGKALQE